MTTEEFEWLVLKAIDGLPSEVVSELCNVDIVVQDNPSELQKISSGLIIRSPGRKISSGLKIS